MGMFNIRNFTAVALVVGSLAATGCYVEPVGPGPVVVGDYGYEPQYYDGYMVYYDGVGRPYYYANGAQVWVSPSSPYYSGYVSHYRTYGGAYNRWYSGDGYRYRNYRGQGGYYGGHYNYYNNNNRYNRGGGYVRARPSTGGYRPSGGYHGGHHR
jgi:hypothetical protein